MPFQRPVAAFTLHATELPDVRLAQIGPATDSAKARGVAGQTLGIQLLVALYKLTIGVGVRSSRPTRKASTMAPHTAPISDVLRGPCFRPCGLEALLGLLQFHRLHRRQNL